MSKAWRPPADRLAWLPPRLARALLARRQVQPASEQIQIDRLMAEQIDRVLLLQHPRECRHLALATAQRMEPSVVDTYSYDSARVMYPHTS